MEDPRSNADKFYDAQYQNAKKLYDDNDEDYEAACLRLLEDPALPLSKRVICCYMIARRFEHHRFYIQQGLETLQKIEQMIQDGRVADRLTPWVRNTRTRFEELQVEIKTPLEEYEASNSTEKETEDTVEEDDTAEEGVSVAEKKAEKTKQ